MTTNPDLWFALALVGLILAVVSLARSRAADLDAWAIGVVALSLCLAWWPG